jgi:hypothetical protein
VAAFEVITEGIRISRISGDFWTFGDIEIVTNAPGPAGLWTSSDVVTNYGEHTSIITNATVQGEIAISF